MTAAATPITGWTRPESPFHDGERALQTRTGVRDKIEAQGRRGVRDYLPDQHRAFYQQLPFILLGTVDADGQPWASLLAGPPGFVSTPDERSFRIAAAPLPGDPLAQSLVPGGAVGILGIIPASRRRNRARGMVSQVDAGGVSIALSQSFGNCPQYIQARTADWIDPTEHARAAGTPSVSDRLDEPARALLAGADTLFIATAARLPGGTIADVSHRGGKPGFIRVDDERTLTIPDFVGNFHFNTFGNISLDPKAGITIVDFETGTLLYLTGTAEVIWDGPDVASFAGAERLLRFQIRRAIRVESALPVRFSAPEFSPILGRTGSWEDAAAAQEAARTRNSYRPFRVAAVTDEAELIRSIHLEPADGIGVVPYLPGQFLPIRLRVPGQPEMVLRTYTLSDAPDGRRYRLSVKREGVASTQLHGLSVGDVIEAMAPRGDFTFDHGSSRPVVMIAGGIGVTPLLAMLNGLLVNDDRSRHHNRIIFIQGARNGRSHPFAAHLRDKAARHKNLTLHVRYSDPGQDDHVGQTHDSTGRIDKALLQQLLPLDDYDIYLCGPGGFMQSLYDILRDLGVPDARIRFEAFGPASVSRRRDVPSGVRVSAAPVLDADEAVEVVFARSGKTARWRPADGTLLDLAEANGIAAAYSCRSGVCGTCAVPVKSGSVDYREEPSAVAEAGHALICCSVPHPGPHLDGRADREGVTLEL